FGARLVEQFRLLGNHELNAGHFIRSRRDGAIENSGKIVDVADSDGDLIVGLEAGETRCAALVWIVLRLQRHPRRLNVALGYPACFDGRQHSRHLLGVCFAGLARGLLQAAHSDANYRGVGWNGNCCLARDCHEFFRGLRCRECKYGDKQDRQETQEWHHFTGTNTLTTSLSGAVFTGSVVYSSMKRSLASSCLSSR